MSEAAAKISVYGFRTLGRSSGTVHRRDVEVAGREGATQPFRHFARLENVGGLDVF